MKDKSESFLLPERWVFGMEQPNVNGSTESLFITIILKIQTIEVDTPIDESVFIKPAGK